MIRELTMYKIKINNAREWDIANYEDLVNKGADEYNPQLSSSEEMEEQVINEQVTIQDFGYSKFKELREMDGIDEKQIFESLSPGTNKNAVFKAGKSTGKSGSFLFFSHDRKFLIKTMFFEEVQIIMENIELYFDYIKENRDSLITRIYGVFQVRMEGMVPINLLLMANNIQIKDPANLIKKVYDLKGSIINRMVTQEELFKQTMKDMNLMTCRQNRRSRNQQGLLQFSPGDMKNLRQIIDRDASFLQSMELLDYSLLLAVEKISDP